MVRFEIKVTGDGLARALGKLEDVPREADQKAEKRRLEEQQKERRRVKRGEANARPTTTARETDAPAPRVPEREALEPEEAAQEALARALGELPEREQGQAVEPLVDGWR